MTDPDDARGQTPAPRPRTSRAPRGSSAAASPASKPSLAAKAPPTAKALPAAKAPPAAEAPPAASDAPPRAARPQATEPRRAPRRDPDAATDDAAAPGASEEQLAEARERSLRKRAASRLGWKLRGNQTVEVRAERVFELGPRVVVVRGRVAVDLPEAITAEAGDAAAALVVDPAAETFVRSVERAAQKILSLSDDVPGRHVYESGSFFTALEQAQRGVVRLYQELENRRLDESVAADLGLSFYLDGLAKPGRRFVYFAGPTNSGKTHAALELLREAPRGIYLAPLRLLALEIQERLTESGVPTSLITGEERVLAPGAGHVSSTVEMVDTRREIEVAVIDEAQMLRDTQRGWAWTLAIAGVKAETVVMCGSEDGVDAVARLCGRLGARLEVRRFERKNPLVVVDAVPPTALQAGDAVVAFSRGAVVELQKQIGRSGRSTAAIYGSLSPAVRRREAERFRSGAADVLVATDAIGLGLNLPIRRLIFAELEKYDGTATRALTSPEIRQIAGRAGRYGFHEHGQVSAFDARSVRLLKERLDRYAPPGEPEPIWISPTDEHLKRLGEIIGTRQMSRLLQFFQTRVLRDEHSDLRIADLSDTIEVAVALEMSDRFAALPLATRSTYCRAPASTRGSSLGVLARWGERHASEGSVDGRELEAGGGARDRLLLAEDRSRLATLYLWLAQRFPTVYVNVEGISALRETLDADIQSALSRHGERPGRRATTTFDARRRKPGAFDKRRLPR